MQKAKRSLLLFSIACCLTLLNGAQRALIILADGESTVPVWRTLIADAAHWYIWCAAVFPILFLARRIPLKGSNHITILFMHLTIGFLFALANIFLQSIVVSFFYDDSALSIMKTAFVA